MTLTFYFHPLSSYCQKALVALYESGAPFIPKIVDLSNEAERAALLMLWPIGKFPVLHDAAGDRAVPESSIIIEYLAQHYPGRSELLPADPVRALQVRLSDRFYDLHVHEHMQKIIGDRLRPADKRDAHGVAFARQRLRLAYDMIEKDMAQKTTKTWATGEDFTMADCAAMPALFYADMIEPFGDSHPALSAYFERLKQRPSVARVLKEAEPYLDMVPQ